MSGFFEGACHESFVNFCALRRSVERRRNEMIKLGLGFCRFVKGFAGVLIPNNMLLVVLVKGRRWLVGHMGLERHES
jgi:hypothetical protein